MSGNCCAGPLLGTPNPPPLLSGLPFGYRQRIPCSQCFLPRDLRGAECWQEGTKSLLLHGAKATPAPTTQG